MTDDTVTGWKTRLLRAWAFAVAHKDYTIPAATFLLGLFLGWLWA